MRGKAVEPIEQSPALLVDQVTPAALAPCLATLCCSPAPTLTLASVVDDVSICSAPDLSALLA